MPLEYHPDPARFRGKGVVFIAYDSDRECYDSYWDLSPDGPPTPLEKGPSGASEAEIIEWALERTPRVLIRPAANPARMYWAGEIPIPPHYSQVYPGIENFR